MVRHAQDPTATSIHARHLIPPLPEAQSGRCLSIAGSLRARLTEGPGLYLGLLRESGGQVGGEIPAAHTNRRVEK
jgi:hypothetical protein